MNVHNQTILHVKAGFIPTKDVVEYLMGKKPNSIGWVVQENDGKPLDVLQQPAADQTVDDVFGFLESTKDNNMSMFFAKLAEGHHPEDVQPFVLDDPDSNKFLSIMLEGDIIGNNADKLHTEHYNYVNGVLIPQLVEICEDSEGDIEKVMAKLRRDSFKNNFFMHVGHRAVLQFIPFQGAELTIAKNQLMKPFDWGWMSQAEGYGDKKAEVPAAAPATTAKRGWGKTKSSITTDPKTGVHTVNSDKPTLTAPAKASVPAAGKAIDEDQPMRPPSWMHKRDDLRFFYTELTGALPANWNKKIPVKVTQNHAFLKCRNEDDVKQYRLQKMMQTTGAAVSKPQTKQERMSSTSTPPAPEVPALPDLPIHGPVDNTPLPIIDPASLDKVLQIVATLDHNSKTMMDPKEMQKIEAELPKFTAQVALSGIQDTMNWKNSDLFAIAATDARAVVILLREWMTFARPYLLSELKAKAKDNVQMTTETKTTQLTPNTTKVESVVKARRWGKRAA